MSVVRRDGKWTLEKEDDGEYSIRERGEVKARVITDDFEPDGLMGGMQMTGMAPTIEVRDFKAAEREFKDYKKQSESRGLFDGGLGF